MREGLKGVRELTVDDVNSKRDQSEASWCINTMRCCPIGTVNECLEFYDSCVARFITKAHDQVTKSRN